MKITPVFDAERSDVRHTCVPAVQYTCCYGSNVVCLVCWRDLIAWSGVRDAELAARLAAERAAHAAGVTEGEGLGRAAVLAEFAAERRDISAAVAAALALGDARAEVFRWRYHVCCRDCRRRGHQAGCEACQDRAPGAFGAPHPDDYLGAELGALAGAA